MSLNKPGRGRRARTSIYNCKGSRINQAEVDRQKSDCTSNQYHYGSCGAKQFILHPDLDNERAIGGSDVLNPLVPKMYGDRLMWGDREFQRLAKALSETDFFQNAGWNYM